MRSKFFILCSLSVLVLAENAYPQNRFRVDQAFIEIENEAKNKGTNLPKLFIHITPASPEEQEVFESSAIPLIGGHFSGNFKNLYQQFRSSINHDRGNISTYFYDPRCEYRYYKHHQSSTDLIEATSDGQGGCRYAGTEYSTS